MIQKTKNHSWIIRDTAEGCKLCVQGKKTVLFITGICSKHCFYCPISEQKWQKDVIYANEWKIDDIKQLVQEIKLCSSEGVGITGGDPLTRISRTCKFIKELKKKFGKKFHIHLYTPLDLVNEKKLSMLYKAGLDEIRFNPDLQKSKQKIWDRIGLARKYDWDIGVEIPIIPGFMKETKELISFIESRVDFLNLNELEISDTNCSELLKRGFKPKDRISYAVKGSDTMAHKLLEHIDKKGYDLNVHYCTATLKDRVQLRNRIKLRAKNHATKFDKITEDGTLIRHIVYLDDLKPGFEYNKRLNKISAKEKKHIIRKLNKINKDIQGILDTEKFRIIIDTKMVSRVRKTDNVTAAKIEEYPTKDSMLISVEFL